MKTPIEKSTVAVIETEDAIVTVIDAERLEREVLKGSIPDELVQRMLPFATLLGPGDNHTHIINVSAYEVLTNSHVIRENETLCKRSRFTYPFEFADSAIGEATCPGCLAKGKAIIVNHLLK